MINSAIFNELTQDVAYWVGYFSAGGNCTTENKVRLVTTPENEDLLISFRNFIGEETVQIRNFLYKGKYEQCLIDVRSDKLCESLDLYALRRSKDLIVPQLRLLKDEFVRDFVRGYFDADGSFASKGDEIARDSAFCDFMRRLEMFMDYASNFIDVESITTKELTELDKCSDDE